MSNEFPFLSAEYAARPQPFWKNLRETDPVYYAQEYGFWVISKHEDILKMLKDPTHTRPQPAPVVASEQVKAANSAMTMAAWVSYP